LILFLENRDSFSFNVVQTLRALGAEVRVESARHLDAARAARLGAGGVVLGPGPGRPEHAGCCVELVHALAPDVPLLGVCLGHQALAAAFGGEVVGARRLVHGEAVAVTSDGAGLWRGLPAGLALARYNSLAVDARSLPAELLVDARDVDGDVMGLRHVERPLFGVQGHPESVLCVDRGGRALLANFLARCGLEALRA
jgi:anthranilate synthase/aminodeoxychorismate synthase-like glutamine amidotransferase